MRDRRFDGLPILIETEKSEGLQKPRLIATDPLDMNNLETLRRLRSEIDPASHLRPPTSV
jgi:hypothetical protein